jgi:GNAT superfamily N-acetyltransferase
MNSFLDDQPRPRPDGAFDVTAVHLESRTPLAAPSPLTGSSKLSVRRTESPTVAFYRQLYHAVGGDWGWVDRKRMSDAEVAAIIEDPKIEVHVFYVDGVAAGYGEMDLRAMPELTLSYFGLLREFHGRGLGAYFLGAVLALAWAKKPVKIHILTQNTEHPAALPLYRKAGFEIVDTKQIVVDLRV